MIYIVSYERYGQKFYFWYPTFQEARTKRLELIRRRLFATVVERKVLTFSKNWSNL